MGPPRGTGSRQPGLARNICTVPGSQARVMAAARVVTLGMMPPEKSMGCAVLVAAILEGMGPVAVTEDVHEEAPARPQPALDALEEGTQLRDSQSAAAISSGMLDPDLLGAAGRDNRKPYRGVGRGHVRAPGVGAGG